MAKTMMAMRSQIELLIKEIEAGQKPGEKVLSDVKLRKVPAGGAGKTKKRKNGIVIRCEALETRHYLGLQRKGWK
ncbi:MAG: hypothetical protein IJU87_09020 [Lachnospiraceae bacterium]|nr:hypothetical protein [Lachnospiraceae bacterium]